MFQAAVHGLGKFLPSKGEFSFPTVCQNTKRFLKNLPLDVNKSPIPLTDFLLMNEASLVAWRNHLAESFQPNTTLACPLRFIKRNGEEPELTILTMGSKSITPATEAVKGSKRGKKKKLDSKVIKGSKGGKRKKRSKSVLSDESSDSDDEKASDPCLSPPPKRQKVSRAAAERAKTTIRNTAEPSAANVPPKASTSRPKPKPVATLTEKKSEPGSDDQVQKKALEKLKQKVILQEPNSFFLQLQVMEKGTLLGEWKAFNFKAEKVSAIEPCNHG
jgi:hypothetical protein